MMMTNLLNDKLISTLNEYFKKINHEVTIVLQKGIHEKREELVTFLKQICSLSEKIKFKELEDKSLLRSPITFTLNSKNLNSGIIFSGIPGGHEFNTFILALLQCGGSDLKLDKNISDSISKINEKLNFEVLISLSCHNCPEVVQILNKFALINNNINSEMIDGGLFQKIVKERKVQGVPSVFLNGKIFLNGRVDATRIVEKLQTLYPHIKQGIKIDHSLQDVTIIGGGPAGISSAIYCARKGLKVLIIVDKLGGQVADTLGIENMISISQTTGASLTSSLIEHLMNYDVIIKENQIVNRIETGEIKKIFLNSDAVVQSKSLIIATGADWRKLNIPGEEENIGKGVAFCPHCEGPFYKGQDVVVVGAGNSGIEAALDLSTIVKSVTVVEYMKQIKADKILIDQLNSRKNIKVICNIQCKEILSDDLAVKGIKYVDRESNISNIIETKAVFIQVGLVPNTKFLKDKIKLNKYGEIIINERGETNVEGVFACGDVTNVPYKQISISIGEGAKAAITSAEYLQKNNLVTH